MTFRQIGHYHISNFICSYFYSELLPGISRTLSDALSASPDMIICFFFSFILLAWWITWYYSWHQINHVFFFFNIYFYLVIWLLLVLVAACRIFHLHFGNMGCLVAAGKPFSGTRDLVLWPATEPEPPALGTQSLSHWTTREVPQLCILEEISYSGHTWNFQFSNGQICQPLCYFYVIFKKTVLPQSNKHLKKKFLVLFLSYI